MILLISFILVQCLEHVSFQVIFSEWMHINLRLALHISILEKLTFRGKNAELWGSIIWELMNSFIYNMNDIIHATYFHSGGKVY